MIRRQCVAPVVQVRVIGPVEIFVGRRSQDRKQIEDGDLQGIRQALDHVLGIGFDQRSRVGLESGSLI